MGLRIARTHARLSEQRGDDLPEVPVEAVEKRFVPCSVREAHPGKQRLLQGPLATAPVAAATATVLCVRLDVQVQPEPL